MISSAEGHVRLIELQEMETHLELQSDFGGKVEEPLVPYRGTAKRCSKTAASGCYFRRLVQALTNPPAFFCNVDFYFSHTGSTLSSPASK